MEHRKKTTSFYVVFGVFAVVFGLFANAFLCVAPLIIKDRIFDFEYMKKQFETTISMTDNAFSSIRMEGDSTSGTMTFFFSYRKEKSNFIPSCITFCNVLCDNNDYYKDDRKCYILHFKRGREYFRFVNEKGRAETNVFMEDYSVLEDFEKISCLQIDARFLTVKQRQHLNDISSDYSFEIVIR